VPVDELADVSKAASEPLIDIDKRVAQALCQRMPTVVFPAPLGPISAIIECLTPTADDRISRLLAVAVGS
jgi:hypothetical protein